MKSNFSCVQRQLSGEGEGPHFPTVLSGDYFTSILQGSGECYSFHTTSDRAKISEGTTSDMNVKLVTMYVMFVVAIIYIIRKWPRQYAIKT